MRVTTKMMYTNFNYNLQTSMGSLYKANEQIATGQKLNRPSDDPTAVSSITSEKSQLSSFAVYQDTISKATLQLNATSNAIENLNTLITNAKQLANSALSATSSDKSTYAAMVADLIDSAIGVANTNVGGRYIFSGYKTDQPAVNTTTGMFQGTSDRILNEINTGTSIEVNVTADELIAYGTTAASSANSGLITTASGFTSPADVFTVNGGSLAISLNGGTAKTVNIPAGSTLAGVRDAINAANMGVRAEVFNANENGTPADYRIMLSASPASPANAISVGVTTADGAGSGLNMLTVASGAGAAVVSVVSPDTTVIGAMSLLKTAIEQGDNAAIQRALTALENVSTKVIEKESDIGIRLNRIDAEKQYLTSSDTNVTNSVSDKLMLSTVDIARVTMEIQQQQTALTSLRTITSGFLNTSLFDFLK
jgi:flagellar hook-associated protein 3 FlgL